MKILYKTYLKGDESFADIASIEWCCDEAMSAVQGQSMYFDSARPILRSTVIGNHTAWPVNFCPFCGAKTETHEIVRVRMVQRQTVVTGTTWIEDTGP